MAVAKIILATFVAPADECGCILMKIIPFFLFLPCAIGLFWLLAYLLFTPRAGVHRKMMRFMAFISLFFLFAALSADENSGLLLHFTLFGQVSALLLVPSFLAYIKEYRGLVKSGIFYRIIWFLPFVHLIVGIESVFSAGFVNCLDTLVESYGFRGPMFPYLSDKSLVVFYACYTYAFRVFLLFGMAVFLESIMSCVISGKCSLKDIYGFFFKGFKADLVSLQHFFSLVLFLYIVSSLVTGRLCSPANLVVSLTECLLLSVFVSLIAFVGTAGRVERRALSGLLAGVRFGNKVDAGEYAHEDVPVYAEKPLPKFAPVNLDSAVAGFEGGNDDALDGPSALLADSIGASFEKLVRGEELFLKKNITLQYVADGLNVMKDELADYVERAYGMSFMSYVNNLRIDYSEQYLLSHDDVTQREIAEACGFSSASAFNTAFSRIKGVTPKIWKDRQVEMSRNSGADTPHVDRS